MSEVPEPSMPAPTGPDVASKVKAPAIALLVVGIINIPLALYNIASSLMTMGAPQQALQGPNMPPDMDPQAMEGITALVQGMGMVGVVLAVIALALAVVIIMGATKMMKLESYGMAMAGAILAMIPCLSPCCLLGLPFGIWAIVVLNNPDVKSAFH
jgi:hypothetical protein